MKRKLLQKSWMSLLFALAFGLVLAGCDTTTSPSTSKPGGGVDPNKVATPVADPGAKAVEIDTEIELTTTTPEATIYYTDDGSDPTDQSSEYAPDNKIKITETKTIKAIAVKDGMTDSDILIAVYTIAQVAKPEISASPVAGEYEKETEVTLTLATITSEAKIYYTDDGSDPTEQSFAYDPEDRPKIKVTKIIKAIAIKDKMADSAMTTVTYTFKTE